MFLLFFCLIWIILFIFVVVTHRIEMNMTSKILSHITTLLLTTALTLIALPSCGSKEEKADTTDVPAKATVIIDDSLRQALIAYEKKPRVNGRFTLMVYDLTADSTVFSYHADDAIPCASCMKLLSGVAGLHLLGTNYKYRTTLFTRGPVVDGVLKGDVTWKATLDPQLKPQELHVFPEALRRHGITKIEGKFVIDLLLHQKVVAEQHWYPWDLSFSHYGLLFKGEDAVKRQIVAAMRAGGIALRDSQVVYGPIPLGSKALFSYHRSIEQVIKRMWKNSSNTQATSLLYAIGHKADPTKEPTVAGVEYLRTFLRDTLQQKSPQLVVHDGCGLCTYNHLSPRALTAILRYGYQHPDIYGVLMRRLSISGVDGTLRREFSAPELRGRIHGKTGTLSHPYGISSLAGYCTGANGHALAFALQCTEMSVLDAHVIQREVCKLLIK